MKRAAALAAALLALAVLLVVGAPRSASSVRPTSWTPGRDLDGAAGARCDLPTAGREALARLHEPAVQLRVRQLPDGAGGTAGPERVSIAVDLPCSMVWGVIAHETAHVRQMRNIGPKLYAILGRDVTEVGADCAAARTGWLPAARWPYLAERHAHGGPVGCTTTEQRTAQQLAPDWG